MTPAEAYAKLVAMHDEDIDDNRNGREIIRHILDIVEGALERKDFTFVQEFLRIAKSEDVGPRYAISILRSSVGERDKLQPFWNEFRDNCWDYMVELDKPGRVRLMRGLLEPKGDDITQE